MLHVSIPGFGDYHLEELVLDYNGTLAIDGRLIPGVREKINVLAKSLRIHVLTADTFGSAAEELRDLPCKLTVNSYFQTESNGLIRVNLGSTMHPPRRCCCAVTTAAGC
jgi:soluble P-type ATPase